MDLRDYASYRCEIGNIDEWQLRKDFDNRQNIGPVDDEESFDLAQLPDGRSTTEARVLEPLQRIDFTRSIAFPQQPSGPKLETLRLVWIRKSF